MFEFPRRWNYDFHTLMCFISFEMIAYSLRWDATFAGCTDDDIERLIDNKTSINAVQSCDSLFINSLDFGYKSRLRRTERSVSRYCIVLKHKIEIYLTWLEIFESGAFA